MEKHIRHFHPFLITIHITMVQTLMVLIVQLQGLLTRNRV